MSVLDQAVDIARFRAGARTPILAISGAQGSGKSTLAARYAEAHEGVIHLSLDDFYLTKAEREDLARAVHPLFITRGVPGTHDLTLMGDTIGALMTAGASAKTPIPRFDKLADDRVPRAQWREHVGRPSLIILEGWCLGASAEREKSLAEPINDLEAKEDRQGLWRRHANAHLAEPYQDFFVCLDAILFLAAPGFDAVLDWRCEQDAGLRGRALSADERAHVARFIAHFERITRHMLGGGRRADIVAPLDAKREIVSAQLAD